MIDIYNLYVYRQITIWQIYRNQPYDNSAVHIKTVNIYLFPKSTELQFGGPQICQIAIWLITLKWQRKRNLSYSECTFG